MNKRYCSVNDWLLDISSGSILHLNTGERKRLGEYQLKLLDILTQHAGEILSREELTNMVWERRVIGNNSLPNAVHALRVALEDDGKQQKIIKTIPKKGYLLESSYCRCIETESLNENENITEIPPEGISTNSNSYNEEEASSDVVSVETSSLGIIPEPGYYQEASQLNEPQPARKHSWLAYAVLMLVAVLVSGAMGYKYLTLNNKTIAAAQQENNVYSNIRLYQIVQDGDTSTSKDSLYIKLKDTLYQLNQRLKTKNIYMDVYYKVSDQVLNYTFSVETTCANQQLAMTIYHWRTDTRQLSNLIFRETVRKINEIPACQSQ